MQGSEFTANTRHHNEFVFRNDTQQFDGQDIENIGNVEHVPTAHHFRLQTINDQMDALFLGGFQQSNDPISIPDRRPVWCGDNHDFVGPAIAF